MAKSTRVNLRSSVVAVLLATVLLAVFVVTFALPAWFRVTEKELISRARARSGLWYACGLNHDHHLSDIISDEDPACFSLLEFGVPAWLRVTQGLAVLALFFALVSYAMWFWIVCGRDWEEKAFNILVPTWILAGVCMVLAVSVYAGNVKTGEERSPEASSVTHSQLAWGFVVATVTAAFWNVMGVVLLVSLVCMYC